MTVKISKPAINLREELASLRNQGGLPKEDKLYLDNLVTNGDFSNGLTGWIKDPSTATLSVSNGALNITRNGAYGEATQKIKTTVGKTYKITFTLTAVSHGFQVNFNGYYSGVKSSTGTYSYYAEADQDEETIYLSILNSSTGTASVDNVSVQEVGENLVTNGTFDVDSFWNKGAGWTISGGTASCDGSQTSNVSFNQPIADMKRGLVIGEQYTLTFTLSGHSGGGVNPHIRNQGYGSYITGNGTYTIVLTAGTGNDGLNFYVQSNFVGSIDNVILTEGTHPVIQSIPYGYDVKDVYIDGELAREGEAYDYQVQTDGINQWLKPTVEPTATTETVVIGVRK